MDEKEVQEKHTRISKLLEAEAAFLTLQSIF